MTSHETRGRDLAAIRKSLGLDVAAVARRVRVKAHFVHSAESGDAHAFDRICVSLLCIALPRAQRGDGAARAALRALMHLMESA